MKVCRATGKRRYPVESRAKRARMTLLRKRNDKKNPHALVAYYCAACLGWHVGHNRAMEAVLAEFGSGYTSMDAEPADATSRSAAPDRARKDGQ